MSTSVVNVASLLVAALLPFSLSAQAVSGLVAEVETGDRIQGAEVSFVDDNGVPLNTVVSGRNGEFYLEASGPGTLSLRIRRIGYKPSTAQVILQTDRVLEVRVNLAPQATQLEGITIYGQTADTPEQMEFLSRRHLPWNFSYDRREIEELRQGTLSDLLTVGIPFVPPCHLLYVDGRPSRTLSGQDRGYLDTLLDWVFGVEVYRTKFDIPLRYREPTLDPRCGAVLVWTTTPSGFGRSVPTVWSVALGLGVGWEKELIELGWRRGLVARAATTFRVRVGRYSPVDLLRSEFAESGRLDPDKHPVYASLYFGKQGPIPVFPTQKVVYSRVAVGGSLYLGQPSVSEPSGDTTRIVTPATNAYVGMGAQVAIGFRYPRGAVRPWLECRTGSEWVMNAGLRWAKPVFLLGIEIGGRR